LIISSFLAKNNAYDFISSTSSDFIATFRPYHRANKDLDASLTKKQNNEISALVSPFFHAFIANADQLTTFSNDGATLVRFNLWGNFDNRVIALNHVYSTNEWQRLTIGSYPSFNTDVECLIYTCNGHGLRQAFGTSTLDANLFQQFQALNLELGVNGGSYNYNKVKKSKTSQTFVKRDYISGVDVRFKLPIFLVLVNIC
jgi:hypothetical protein